MTLGKTLHCLGAAAAAGCAAFALTAVALAGDTNSTPAPRASVVLGTGGPVCAAEDIHEARLARDPDLAERMGLNEETLQRAISGLHAVSGPTDSTPLYIIPVVVHVVHDPSTPLGTAENVSAAQIQSQIDALNRDFGNTLALPAPAVDTRIQFCLTGVTRHPNALTDHDWPAEESAVKALGYLPSANYLNIWVVRSINYAGNTAVAGYGTFPGTVTATLDGVVIRHDVFGSNSFGSFPTLLPGYDDGKIMTHEAGHYLYVYHTFHGGCGPPGDFVNDTPPIATNNVLCPSSAPDTCTSDTFPDQIENFMDYTNDVCRELFTADQRDRMQGAILNFRSTLVDPTNLITVGCSSGSIPVIVASDTQVCTNPPSGDTVVFTTPTSAVTYQWTFQGGTPPTATGPGPHTVTYTTPGTWDVTLTVTDSSSNTNTLTEPDLVYADACGPINSTQGCWFFGINAGLTFGSGTAVAVSGGQIATDEGCATQCNATSGLLFYTNGEKVWNPSHVVMPNGSGLLGHGSAYQGVVIVPRPGSATQYFIFTVPAFESGSVTSPLKYSVVDMTLNAGQGDIVAGQKNLPVSLPAGLTGLSEAIKAVPHCNGTDWWVITQSKSAPGNEDIYVNLVTSAGPGPYTVYPALGCPASSGLGTMAVSPDGSLFAIGVDGCVKVYRFDRSTGALTNYPGWPNPPSRYYALSFSPNSRLLYSQEYDFGLARNRIIQTDLTTFAERTLVDLPYIQREFSEMQLGPDGKIYVTSYNRPNLSVINSPNSFNTANANESGFNLTAIPLGGPLTSRGIPNMLDAQAGIPTANFSYTVSSCKTYSFVSHTCGTSFSWNFGDSTTSTLQNPVHTYATAGTYTVTLTVTNGAGTSSTSQTITVGLAAPPIFGPTNACANPSNYSTNIVPGLTYQWNVSGGVPATSTANNVDVTWGPSGGTVTLSITDPATGCTSATSIQAVTPCGSATLQGVKFEDLDRDGIHDVGEPPLLNWTIRRVNSLAITQTALTNALGQYSFTGQPPGTYDLWETGQPDWVQTMPLPIGKWSVTVTGSPTISNLDFGNYHCPPDGGTNEPCVVPPTDMVAWWPMDAFVPGGFPCTPGDGIAFTTDIVRVHDDRVFGDPTGSGICGPTPGGVVAGAIQFDGADDYIEAPNTAALNFGIGYPASDRGNFSIDAWVRTSAAQGVVILVDKRLEESGTSIQGYSLFLSSGILSLQMGDGVGSTTCSTNPATSSCTNYSSGVNVANGAWRHVAVTVDRDQPTGGTFYVDGVAVATFDPTIRDGDLSNTRPLRIARRSDSSSPGFLRGALDEVEIFRRALLPSEVAGIYNANKNGKCKKPRCHLPLKRPFLLAQTSATVGMTICNYTGMTDTFNWSLAPLPNTIAGCDVAGPVSFNPAAGVVTLLAGQCTTFPVVIGRPAGFTANGLVACYQLTSVARSTGRCFNCRGSVQDRRKWWVHPVPIILDVARVSSDAGEIVRFRVGNADDPGGTLPYRITVRPPAGTANRVVSLNGLPPGVPIGGLMQLGMGESSEIDVDVSYLQHEPFEFYDVLFIGDLDGDGSFDEQTEALSSTGARSVQEDSGATECDATLPVDAITLGWVDRVRLRWNPLRACDGTFNVYRSVQTGLTDSTGTGLADDYGSCFQSDLATPEADDNGTPPVGWMSTYLVTAENLTGEGSLGRTSAGGKRPNRSPCP